MTTLRAIERDEIVSLVRTAYRDGLVIGAAVGWLVAAFVFA